MPPKRSDSTTPGPTTSRSRGRPATTSRATNASGATIAGRIDKGKGKGKSTTTGKGKGKGVAQSQRNRPGATGSTGGGRRNAGPTLSDLEDDEDGDEIVDVDAMMASSDVVEEDEEDEDDIISNNNASRRGRGGGRRGGGTLQNRNILDEEAEEGEEEGEDEEEDEEDEDEDVEPVDVDVPVPSEAEEEEDGHRPLSPALLSHILHFFFRREGTRITSEANYAFMRYVDVFVREAIARSLLVRPTGFLEVEDLEKIAFQLLLDV